MEYITLTDKQKIKEFKPEILDLFAKSFGYSIDKRVWDWAYIDNPSADPIVTLCIEGNALVGHYAIIPMPLILDTCVYSSYLSMTTMVSPTHQGMGLFTNLAKITYEAASDQGVDFVFGFPNNQSAPGFTKKLGWDVLDPDHVVSARKKDILDSNFFREHPINKLSLNLENKNLRKWRLEKPGEKYIWQDGLVFKRYEEGVDLVYFRSPENIKSLPESDEVNFIVPPKLCERNFSEKFAYQFGGVGINSSFYPSHVNRQMILSDVF